MKKIYTRTSTHAREEDGDPVMYRRFVKRWEEVMDLPVQTVGPFTSTYKVLVKRLKVMPLSALIACSLLLVIAFYMLFGSTITILVSILQKGF